VGDGPVVDGVVVPVVAGGLVLVVVVGSGGGGVEESDRQNWVMVVPVWYVGT
jgi:hypothetical protein